MKLTPPRLLGATLAVAILALTGCAGASAPGAAPSAGGDCTPLTAADIAKKYPDAGVEPVYDVTTCAAGMSLAFTNPNTGEPFFNEWDKGMKAAADFYGIQLATNDAAARDEDIPNLYQQLTVREPKVYGTHVVAEAIAKALQSRTQAEGTGLLLVDNTIDGIDSIGLPDSQAGQLAGETAGAVAAERLAGEWKGQKVVYVGLTNPTCEPCQKRVKAGQEAVEKLVPIAESTLLDGYTGRDVATGPKAAFTDFLTSNPDTKIVAVSLNDESGVGIYQAAKQQGRQNDVVLATIGGAQAGREILRENAGDMVAGLVDANPFAEGWNWVAAAVAVADGQEYAPYSLSRVITSENLSTLFPND